jgi:hypothetical protein
MATDVSALSTYSNVTREAHRKRVNYAGNKYTWLWDNFKASTEQHAGESRVNFSLKYQLPESAAYSAEAQAHPAAIQPAYAKGYLYIKKLIAIMKYNEEVVHLSKGPEAIIKDLVDLRVGTTDTYMMLRDHSIHTPGSGVLCQATGAAAGQVVTMNSVRWLRVGMVLDGYDASNNNDADSVAITNINPTTKAVTFTGTVSSVDASTLFYYENTWTTSGSRTIVTTRFTNGIETICSDADPIYGDFEGLDRGTYAYAQATAAYGASAGTAEAWTFDRMYDLIDAGRAAVGSENVPLIAIGSPKCVRAVYNAFRNENQPTVFMPAKDGMPDGLKFQYGAININIVADEKAAPNTLYMPNFKYCWKYNGGPEGWDTYAGGIRFVADYQQFEEIYRGWWNYGTDFPQANMALFDITEA